MPSKPYGYTLIEILIALSILAIALLGLTYDLNTTADHYRVLKEKTLAHWVANAVLAQLSLGNLSEKQASTQMANQAWPWQLQTQKTSTPCQLHAIISVFHPGSQQAITRIKTDVPTLRCQTTLSKAKN